MKSLLKTALPCSHILILTVALLTIPLSVVNGVTQQEVTEYVRTNVLDGSFEGLTLWMTNVPLDQTYFARDINPAVPDVPFPYERTWLVMIDDAPTANWAHPCRWLFVNDNLLEHTGPIEKNWPPSIWSTGAERRDAKFGCVPGLPGAGECPSYTVPRFGPFTPGLDNDCLYAILISGGFNDNSNYSRYAENLGRMYKRLQMCGYPQDNIWVYYAGYQGLPDDPYALDLDGDGQEDDVDGGAYEGLIQANVAFLCSALDPEEDILFIYTSNHGTKDGAGISGLVLWDLPPADGQLQAVEVYTPAELGEDTENCDVCRLFMILDQCFSGLFLNMATDGFHGNTAVYTASDADHVSYASQYLDAWMVHNPRITTLNDMHPATLPGWPEDPDPQGCGPCNTGKAEGTLGNGDVSLCACCPFIFPPLVPTLSEYGLIVLFLLLITAGIIVIYHRRRVVV